MFSYSSTYIIADNLTLKYQRAEAKSPNRSTLRFDVVVEAFRPSSRIEWSPAEPGGMLIYYSSIQNLWVCWRQPTLGAVSILPVKSCSASLAERKRVLYKYSITIFPDTIIESATFAPPMSKSCSASSSRKAIILELTVMYIYFF